jgi:hypothetical protein
MKTREKRERRAALAAIKFSEQHWWKDQGFIQRLTENQISIEEQKAAVWYEAARRRSEVHKAFVEGKFSLVANGWQFFTNFVVNHLAAC